eukprot:10739599-Alexandrium_andersonii.AAC.1
MVSLAPAMCAALSIGTAALSRRASGPRFRLLRRLRQGAARPRTGTFMPCLLYTSPSPRD